MSPIVEIPNRPTGGQTRHISDIIEDFDALLEVVNGGLDEENFSADGFIGGAQLTDITAEILGMSKIGSTRRGFTQVPGAESTSSGTYGNLATPHPQIVVEQGTSGLTVVYASVRARVAGTSGGGHFTALNIDGTVSKTMIANTNTGNYKLGSVPGSQNGAFCEFATNGECGFWVFNRPGVHSYKLVHATTGGEVGTWAERELFVMTSGYSG